jgi:hypothetical protein
VAAALPHLFKAQLLQSANSLPPETLRSLGIRRFVRNAFYGYLESSQQWPANLR